MAKQEAEQGEMFTAGKLAEKFGVPAGKIKKVIQELAIEADKVKGACSYYSEATAAKIELELIKISAFV